MYKFKVGDAIKVKTYSGRFVGICISRTKSSILLRSSVSGCVIDYNILLNKGILKDLERVPGSSRETNKKKLYNLHEQE